MSSMYSPVGSEEYVREELWKKVVSNQQFGHPVHMGLKELAKEVNEHECWNLVSIEALKKFY